MAWRSCEDESPHPGGRVATDLHTKWLGNWPPSGMTSRSATATSGPLAGCLCSAPALPHHHRRRHRRRPARWPSSGACVSPPRQPPAYCSSAATASFGMPVPSGQVSSPSSAWASASRLPCVTDLDSFDLEDTPPRGDPPRAVLGDRSPVHAVLINHDLVAWLSTLPPFISGFTHSRPTRRKRRVDAHRHQRNSSPGVRCPSGHPHRPVSPLSHVTRHCQSTVYTSDCCSTDNTTFLVEKSPRGRSRRQPV